ncbi:MAG: phospho-N-acetylmuramoyl-pentapeptide-transferase [bacterium]
MLFYLSYFSERFFPLNVFKYVTFRSLGAAVTAFLLTLLIGPMVIRMLRRLKLGQPIRQKEEVHQLAELHGAKAGTPTMGGMMILLTVTISSLLWVELSNSFLWLTLTAMLLMGLLGFWDDFKKIRKKESGGISSRNKFIWQILIAAGVGVFLLLNPATMERALELQVPFLKEPVVSDLGWLALFFIILVIVGSSNAVNLTDGLDGLAVGCTTSVACVYAVFSYLAGHSKTASYLFLPYVPGAGELAVFCAALAGASLGFLWFNCHPARVFMGDTGSLAIGGSLAVVAVCIKQELLLALVGGVFVMEALSVILQVASFKLTGKRIFAMSPLHHHFELRGWSETAVVVRFWILGLVFALLGLAMLKLR